jgi:hypothetical protein
MLECARCAFERRARRHASCVMRVTQPHSAASRHDDALPQRGHPAAWPFFVDSRNAHEHPLGLHSAQAAHAIPAQAYRSARVTLCDSFQPPVVSMAMIDTRSRINRFTAASCENSAHARDLPLLDTVPRSKSQGMDLSSAWASR